MEKNENGQVIIDLFKALKNYPTDDAKLARYLSATRLAGRVGLFLSCIKGFDEIETSLSESRIRALYNDVGIDDISFKAIIKPWIVNHGMLYETTNINGDIIYIATVFSYDNLLESVTTFFEENVAEESMPYEAALHFLYKECSTVPRGEHDIRQRLSSVFNNMTVVNIVFEIAKAYKVLSFSMAHSSAETVIYNEKLWKGINKKMLSAIPTFPNDQKAYIEVMIQKVVENQGIPEEYIRKEARDMNSENILNFCIRLGLLNVTTIYIANGKYKNFLTTPHFYAKVKDEFGDDVCDKVKLFLDSIRHGQFYGDGSTGRIKNPEALLSSLLNNRILTGCSALVTDYTMAEKAGIIKIIKGKTYKENRMEVVQVDVIEKTLDVIQYKNIMTSTKTPIQYFDTNGNFRSIQENRVMFAELPSELAEAENELLTNLREGL